MVPVLDTRGHAFCFSLNALWGPCAGKRVFPGLQKRALHHREYYRSKCVSEPSQVEAVSPRVTIWRWGHWEAIGVESGHRKGRSYETGVLLRGGGNPRRFSLSACTRTEGKMCEDAARRWPSAKPGRRAHQKPNGPEPPELAEDTFMLFKAPGLCYSAKAAPADEDGEPLGLAKCSQRGGDRVRVQSQEA